VDHRPFIAVSDRLDALIQHGIHKFGIGPRAYCPAHHKTIEAVDQRRQIHLAGRDLDFGNVGEPLLVRGSCTEVAIDDVLRRRAYFSAVRKDIVLELQLPDVASKRFDLLFQFRTLTVRCWLLLAFHGCWGFTTE